MLNVKFIKFQPTTYVLKYGAGRIRREGAGLAFFYYAPTTALVAVPMASEDAPFIFEEASADFQTLTIQGQVTYRIADPKKIAALLDFSINPLTQQYVSDDPQKLSQRIINAVKVLTRKGMHDLPLRDALKASDRLAGLVGEALTGSEELQTLGIEVLGLSIRQSSRRRKLRGHWKRRRASRSCARLTKPSTPAAMPRSSRNG